jgi:hypothetical protein
MGTYYIYLKLLTIQTSINAHSIHPSPHIIKSLTSSPAHCVRRSPSPLYHSNFLCHLFNSLLHKLHSVQLLFKYVALRAFIAIRLAFTSSCHIYNYVLSAIQLSAWFLIYVEFDALERYLLSFALDADKSSSFIETPLTLSKHFPNVSLDSDASGRLPSLLRSL